MSYEKSEPGRVAPVIPGRHGPALRRKHDIYYLRLNSRDQAPCVAWSGSVLFQYRPAQGGQGVQGGLGSSAQVEQSAVGKFVRPAVV